MVDAEDDSRNDVGPSVLADTKSGLPQPSVPMLNQIELFKAIEVVERDSIAIDDNFTTLLSSLRLALSEVSGSSVEHMQCFSDAAGRLQESAIGASTRGNRYINSCYRLNEEMKGADNLAAQLKHLRKTVDTLESQLHGK